MAFSSAAPPPPRTITKEWEDAATERAKEMKINPIHGLYFPFRFKAAPADVIFATQQVSPPRATRVPVSAPTDERSESWTEGEVDGRQLLTIAIPVSTHALLRPWFVAARQTEPKRRNQYTLVF